MLASPALRAEDAGELLPAGQLRERPIVADEAHVYRVEVEKDPVLVLVEQKGIDLVVEARGPESREVLQEDAQNSRWGSEVLLLPREPLGVYRVEVRPGSAAVARGSYTIRVEALAASPQMARRLAALEAMSRAGRVLPGTSDVRSQALSAYREALAAWRSLGELRWEAETLFDAAMLELQTGGDLRATAEHFAQAAALWRDLANRQGVASSLRSLGVVRQRSGEVVAARQALEESLALWQALGERTEEAETRGALCTLEQTSGSPEAALACYQDLLTVHRELGNRRGEATVLNGLGGVYDALGKPDDALAHYEQALAIWRTLGDREREAQTLGNLAVLHRVLGEWQEALRVYDQVREIQVTSARRSGEATLRNNVGFAYLTMGESERARVLLEEALKLRREMGERTNQVITLNNLGLAWRRLGKTDQALDHHRQALDLAIALDDSRLAAVSRLRLGEDHLDRGDAAGALREIEPALAFLSKSGDRRREVEVLFLRARALAKAGRPQEGVAALREVLSRYEAMRDRAGEAEALDALALVERSLGLLDAARTHAGEAVARVEKLRTGFISPDLRASFLATRRQAYELMIDLLMDRHAVDPKGGHDREAFAMSEQARARTLLDALRSGSGRRAGSAVPAQLLEQRQSLRRRLSVMAAQQVKKEGTEAAALEREIEPLLTKLDGVEAEIGRHDPQYAAFSEPPSTGPAEIAKLLDPGTLFLEYALGEERSFLWAVDAGGLHTYVLPSQRKIEDLARQVYEELSTVEAGNAREEAAQALGRILLEPIWNEMAGVRRLVVVPDAALNTLPFSALQVPAAGKDWSTPGRQPLLELCEVVYLPSAAALALQRRRLEGRPPAPKWAAVLADPVFSAGDPRLAALAKAAGLPAPRPPAKALSGADEAGGLLPRFEPLAASREEADMITSLAPASQVVWTARGLAASRETVLSGELRAYRIVHFATHAIADSRNPELSGLVLSLVDAAGNPQDGFVGLSDIYDLDLAADLVVLSGCRTGIGREVRGEGLMGLTRGFLYAGVPRVVASLWPVEDHAAAELMKRFYQGMWQEGLSPAASLRQAQRSLRSIRRYRSSFSWAGFVLLGDWR